MKNKAKLNCFEKTKERWQKKIKRFETMNFKFSTELSINYSTCCVVVLMQHKGWQYE